MRTRSNITEVLVLAGLLAACGGSSGTTPATGGTTTKTGGTASTGGTTAATGGIVATGGSASTGGTVATGGIAATGGSGSGGVITSGGSTSTGGAVSTGGVSITGGTSSTGGVVSGGGTSSTGGISTTGGASATGGSLGTGGTATDAGTTGGVSSTGGGSSTGGVSSTGGSTVATGGTTSTGTPVTCAPAYATSGTRPQLSDSAAACYTIKNYLAQAGTIGSLVRDDWDPSTASTTVPAAVNYTVAADGSGTHTSVQAAITAAMEAGGTSRKFILVKPGTYRELVCVKGNVPVTLYGTDPDASKVVIAFDNYASLAVDAARVNPCTSPSGTYGTTGSTTFFANANDFQAMNLTIANDYKEPDNGTYQAVALSVQADKNVFQNVRLLGNQDTLQVRTSATTKVARSYFKSCYVEGDVDFVFGRGTAVFDGCTFQYITTRGKKGSTIFAPSTENAHPFGFLVIKSTLGADSGAAAGSIYLGRDWEDSSGTAPNGQILIRESTFDTTIRTAGPWGTSTKSTPFDPAQDRLFEYKNTGG